MVGKNSGVTHLDKTNKNTVPLVLARWSVRTACNCRSGDTSLAQSCTHDQAHSYLGQIINFLVDSCILGPELFHYNVC